VCGHQHLLRYGRRHVERLSPHPFQTSRRERGEEKIAAARVTKINELADEVEAEEASRAGWLGVVETPDGCTGVSLGSFGIATSELTMVDDGNEQEDGDTGVGQRSFDDQWLLANANIAFVSFDQQTGSVGVGPLVGGLSYSALIADQSGGNGDPSLSPGGHTIQSQDDVFLLSREGTALPQTIVDCNGAIHPILRVSGTLVGRGTIGVSDFDIRRDLASPGGNGAITDPEVLKLEKFTLGSLGAQDVLGRNGGSNCLGCQAH
jgi:hypothetical protein